MIAVITKFLQWDVSPIIQARREAHALAVVARSGCNFQSQGRRRQALSAVEGNEFGWVPVRALFGNLEDGATVNEFLTWFPGATREQVEAVLEHAGRNLAAA